MTLEEFVTKFVMPNSIIRLWFKVGSHYQTVFRMNRTFMEWEIINASDPDLHPFLNYEVLGVKDILVLKDDYSESVNIVLDHGS